MVALPGIIIAAPPPTPLQEPPPTARPAAGGGERKARLFLLAVGVSKYSRKEYALGLPAKDAGDFASLMSGQGGRMYASVHARLLTDEKATRSAVLDALAWMRDSVGPNDTGMLFIAGHGVNDSNGRYYFLPHDAEVERLASTAIGESELRKTLAALPGKAMLFVDTCHAGNVIGTGAAVNNEIARLANTLAAAENGVIVFSASTGRQDSVEDMRWGNGAFTKALIEGLKGAADFRQDGVVTHQGLSYFLGRAVKTLTKGRQTPVTAVPLGMIDFPLVQL